MIVLLQVLTIDIINLMNILSLILISYTQALCYSRCLDQTIGRRWFRPLPIIDLIAMTVLDDISSLPFHHINVSQVPGEILLMSTLWLIFLCIIIPMIRPSLLYSMRQLITLFDSKRRSVGIINRVASRVIKVRILLHKLCTTLLCPIFDHPVLRARLLLLLLLYHQHLTRLVVNRSSLLIILIVISVLCCVILIDDLASRNIGDILHVVGLIILSVVL